MKRVLNMTAVVAGLLALGMGCDAGDDRPAEDTDEAGTASTGSSDPSDGDSTSGETDPQGSTTGSDTGDTTGGEETDGGDDGGDTDDGTTGGEVPAEAGMLFSLGNDADQNAVVAYRRSPDGSLERLGEFATGGMGTGSGLGSQSSLALADDDVLYVVNAGDDTVSSMRLYDDHLALVDIAASGGVRPTSVTLAGDRLYVLNADGAGSIAGFDLEEGRLTPIAAASRPLSGHEGPAPAQIGATPSGDYLIVTERATNQILAYEVDADGGLSEPTINDSEGQTPFGFDFTTAGVFIVSEAFGGGMNPGASAASSYRVADGGGLWTFTASAPSGQTAACWIQVVRDQFAYATNTGSNTLSGYHVDQQGGIELFSGGGDLVDLGDGHAPIDLAVSADEQYLYVLNAAADTIEGFFIADDGMLDALEVEVDVPPSAVGLIGF